MFCAPTPDLTTARVPTPNGAAGVFHTLRVMRAYVNASKTDPRIINAAVSVIYLQSEKDSYHEARALFEYVRDVIRYVQDTVGLESLTDPILTLQRQVGDCDDQTTLLAALLESVGYPTRFVIAGYHGSDFEHVYLQTLVNGQWIDADPTEHQPFGWAPPSPSVYYVERV